MKSILITLLIFISISLQAQEQSLDKVFDDGGLSNIKNNVSISASDLVEGFFTVGYNRYIGERSALGLSFGLYLFSGPALHWNFGANKPYYSQLDDITYARGYLFRFSYRVYISDHDGLFMQYGFMYKSRGLDNADYKFLAIPEFKYGYSWTLLDRFCMSATAGLGFGFHVLKETSTNLSIFDIEDMSVYIPINIELAYEF
jgi:hypothetical protein